MLKEKSFSAKEARQIAIHAQLMTKIKGNKIPGTSELKKILRKIALLQIDSVNVCVRAHYMPLFSRMGPYPQRIIEEAAYSTRDIFETWAHEACFAPVDFFPVIRHRMTNRQPGKRVLSLMETNPGYLENVLEQVRSEGPIKASELTDPGNRTGKWWGYSKGKIALEWYFAKGVLGVSKRKGFTRYYDLIERIMPENFLNAPPLSEKDAHKYFLLKAINAYGISTISDIADYFRIKKADIKSHLDQLIAKSVIEEVSVEGWEEPGYCPRGLNLTPTSNCQAILSPFDSFSWNRHRLKRLFKFHYRIEIYVPESKRKFGYYVYPFILGDKIVARIDLKADHKNSTLIVQSAYIEVGNDKDYVAERLLIELSSMAIWLNLSEITIKKKGNLAERLLTIEINKIVPVT